jgi:hypothetical protein
MSQEAEVDSVIAGQLDAFLLHDELAQGRNAAPTAGSFRASIMLTICLAKGSGRRCFVVWKLTSVTVTPAGNLVIAASPVDPRGRTRARSICVPAVI